MASTYSPTATPQGHRSERAATMVNFAMVDPVDGLASITHAFEAFAVLARLLEQRAENTQGATP